jgi:hypothetical protein
MVDVIVLVECLPNLCKNGFQFFSLRPRYISKKLNTFFAKMQYRPASRCPQLYKQKIEGFFCKNPIAACVRVWVDILPISKKLKAFSAKIL